MAKNTRIPRAHSKSLPLGRSGRLFPEKNLLLPKKVRQQRQLLESAVSTFRTFEDKMAWVVTAGAWMRRFGPAVLLPLWLITTVALFGIFGATPEVPLWRTAPLWFFTLGCGLWVVQFFWVWKPVWLYVLGHEFTHAAFTKICFGKIHAFKVTAQGGHVVTDRNNWLISLSPYFFPIYAIGAAVVFWVLGKMIDLNAWREIGLTLLPGLRLIWLVYLVLGVLWGFHMTFTAWMILKDQPDLKMNGTFFSLNLIALINVLLLCLLLALAAPGMDLADFFTIWKTAAKDTIGFFAKISLAIYGWMVD